MFAFIFPFTGLSSTTVLIGLVAYSLVILVRNFLAGLQGVPDDVREAARGMGYGAAAAVLADRPAAGAAGVHGRPADRHRLHRRAGHGRRARRARRARPADHRRLQRQLLPGRDRHRHRAAACCWRWSPTCCWPASSGCSPRGRGRCGRERLRGRARLPQRPVQLDPAQRHPRPARRAPARSRWSPCWPRSSLALPIGVALGHVRPRRRCGRRAVQRQPGGARPWRC